MKILGKFLILTMLFALASCSEEISEDIQKEASSDGSSGSVGSDPDDVPFSEKSIRVVNKNGSDKSYLLHKEGDVSAACELDSPSTGFDADTYDRNSSASTINCVLDAQELDLYFGGAELEVQVDSKLCEYVRYRGFKFLQYQPGKTVQRLHKINCDAVCSASLGDSICGKTFKDEDNSAFETGDICWDFNAGVITADLTQVACEAVPGDGRAWIENDGDLDTDYLPQAALAATYSNEFDASTGEKACKFDHTDDNGIGPNCDQGAVTTNSYNLNAIDGPAACSVDPAVRVTQETCESTAEFLISPNFDTSFCWDDSQATIADALNGDDEFTCQLNGFDWYDINDYVLDDPAGLTYDTGGGSPTTFKLGSGECSVRPTASPNAPFASMAVYRQSVDFNIVDCRSEAGAVWEGPACIDTLNGVYTREQTRTACEALADHEWSQGSCDDPLRVTSSEATCTNAAVWETELVCDATSLIEVDTVSEVEISCAGNPLLCLAGPGVDSGYARDESGEIYTFDSDQSFTQSIPIPSPFTSGYNSNMYIANHSRICSSTSVVKADADFDTILNFLNGPEIEDISNSFYVPVPVDDNDDGSTDYEVHADHPLKGRAYTTLGSGGPQPYYSIACLDQSNDVKAQIRVFIREWDRDFETTNVYLNRISDINQGANALMDAIGSQPNGGGAWNDFKDWDDFLNDYDFTSTFDSNPLDGGGGVDNVFTNNQCSGINLGTCYDSSIPAADPAFVDQTSCNAASVNHYWIPSKDAFPEDSL